MQQWRPSTTINKLLFKKCYGGFGIIKHDEWHLLYLSCQLFPKIKDSLGFIEIKKNFYELNDNYESHYYESESKNKSEHENKAITERR